MGALVLFNSVRFGKEVTFARWWADLRQLARECKYTIHGTRAQFKEFYFEDGLTPEEALKEEMYYTVKG